MMSDCYIYFSFIQTLCFYDPDELRARTFFSNRGKSNDLGISTIYKRAYTTKNSILFGKRI